jgi:hypothetical protein
MLTHVHMVIHKVVGTFAKGFKRKRKVEIRQRNGGETSHWK